MSTGPMIPFGKGGPGLGLGLGTPFVNGLLVGAAVAYILTNEDVQKTLFRGVARVIGTVQGGIEEMRERYRDAEAEIEVQEETE